MSMNLNEGIRRVGILLGLLGATFGAVLGYQYAAILWNAHLTYLEFESSMALPTMRKVAKAMTVDYDALAKQTGAIPSMPSLPPGYKVDDPADWETISQGDGEGGTYLFKANPLLEANHDGIKRVHVDAAGAVSSIEFSTGQIVQRTKPPAITAYFLPFLYPLIGFLIPWGGLRILAWVARGFIEPASTARDNATQK